MTIEVKKFTTNCENINGSASPVTLYIGHPFKDSHPLAFQNKWLSNRGISIPANVMESFSKLMEISEKNNLPFIDLVDYVIKEVELGKSLLEDSKKATEISKTTNAELKESDNKINIEDSQTKTNEPIENQESKNSANEIDKNEVDISKKDKNNIDNSEINQLSDEALKLDNNGYKEEDKIKNNEESQSLFKKISDKK